MMMMMSSKHTRLSGSRANNKQPYHVNKLQSSKTEPQYQTRLTTSPPWPPLPHYICIVESLRPLVLTASHIRAIRSKHHQGPEKSRTRPNLTKNIMGAEHVVERQQSTCKALYASPVLESTP